MRLFITLIIASTLLGCKKNSELKNQIFDLKVENDSLRNLVKDYESKYVYERVFIKHFKTNSEPNKIGNTYKGEFVFVPDVRKDKVQFMAQSRNTKFGYDEKKPIILETKSGDFGAYPFEFKIMSDTTKIFFKPIIKDSLSLSHQNIGYDGVTISDIILAN